jgi:hypothetical protein
MSFEDSSGGDGLDELRRRLGDVSMAHKRPDEMTVRELVAYIERLVHLVHVRIDGLSPGADDKVHYDDHAEIQAFRVNSKQFWADVRSRLFAGLVGGIGLAFAVVLVGLLYVLSTR